MTVVAAEITGRKKSETERLDNRGHFARMTTRNEFASGEVLSEAFRLPGWRAPEWLEIFFRPC